MIRYKGVNHLALVTGDMDATIRFWRDLLGMRLVIRMGKPGYRQYFFEIRRDEFVAFFEWPGAGPIAERDHGYPVSGPIVFDHVSFGVESRDDLWNLKDKLEQGGFWTSEVIDHGFIHSLYSFDPNGVAIEFSWSVEGVEVGETPRMLDFKPSEVAMEGPEPQPGAWAPVEKPTPAEERRAYPGVGSELFNTTRR